MQSSDLVIVYDWRSVLFGSVKLLFKREEICERAVNTLLHLPTRDSARKPQHSS